MKVFSKIALASLILAASTSVAMADDYDIAASYNYISQGQHGNGNMQEIKLAVIADDVDADIEIKANGNSINQHQGGSNNKQKISVATVGCDC